MATDFVHLHVHSDFSMLDGACHVGRLCDRALELGQNAVAVTDHGNMFGVLELYKAAAEKNVKPLLGCEFYVSEKPVADHTDGTRYHLILLAKNYAGYQSLCRLTAEAYSDDGFYYKARIDRDILTRHAHDLVCLTACIAGEIPEKILKGRETQARDAIRFYRDLFGPDDFFFELQYHGAPGMRPEDAPDEEQGRLLHMEDKVNRRLRDLAEEYGVGLVCTNDAHYLRREDADAHDCLLCIGTQSMLDDRKRLRFSGDQFYLKSGDEMAELFADYPDAVENTVRIAEKCTVTMPLGKTRKNHYPVFRLENASDDPADLHCSKRRAYLRSICLEGLQSRYTLREADNPAYAPSDDSEPAAEKRAEILTRMNYELDVIDRMGYISYFLVVWDFIRYARRIGVPVGPGRGSGAGSLVAYLTGITDLDPLRYQLLFERFLNPDRVSPPDFDIDFCERRRSEVIEYVRDKYGAASVAQIGTFGTLKAKQVLKDVARVKGVPFADAQALVSLIPTDPKMTLKTALTIPEVNERYENDPDGWIRDTFEKGKVLEGLNRNQSIHACGVIIGDEPLANVLPLARGAGKEWITQFPAGPCEELGMLKMDFLGLKTLTIIEDTIDMLNAAADNGGGRLTPDSIPLGDARTFELLNRGKTVAVFQLESGGMQDLCRSFNLSKLEEIIALVALYRPGPMDFIPTYVNCKLGREQPEYDTPEMRSLLGETYGIMVYQEQIMQVCQAVAGFSLAQADLMRRAISKKKEKLMLEYGEKFKVGVVEHGGYPPEIADSIWKKILEFAKYGFNKSHSACYALLSYRTAYLKANHSAEFMAAVLNGELGDAEKMQFYIGEAAAMGLRILPPDVNSSGLRFGVSDGDIRFGLGAVKGVGSGAAEAIIENRRTAGPYRDLFDFCARVGAKVTKRVLASLGACGAFDTMGLLRGQVEAMADEALQYAHRTAADISLGQATLFDAAELLPPPPKVKEWDHADVLRKEKELLGFYVSGHPLDDYADLLEHYALDTVGSLLNDEAIASRPPVRVGGLLAEVTLKRTKKDSKQFAVLNLEGRDGAIECMAFSDTYEKFGTLLKPQECVFVEGEAQQRNPEDSPSLVASKIVTMKNVPQEYAAEIHLRIPEERAAEPLLEELKTVFEECSGATPVLLCIICTAGTLAFVEPSEIWRVANNQRFRTRITELLGPDALYIKPNRTRPEARRKRRWKDRQNGNGNGGDNGNGQ